MLDNGNGLEEYSDVSHHCRFTQLQVEKKGQQQGGQDGKAQPSNVDPINLNFIVAKARGDTEFGPFVSYGAVEVVHREFEEVENAEEVHEGERGEGGEGGRGCEGGVGDEVLGMDINEDVQLTLCRRYLDDSDERLGWNLQAAVGKDGLRGGSEGAPWTCLRYKYTGDTEEKAPKKDKCEKEPKKK